MILSPIYEQVVNEPLKGIELYDCLTIGFFAAGGYRVLRSFPAWR